MKPLIQVSENLVFNLSNLSISYLFQVSPEGILEHLHFGGKVTPGALAAGPRRPFRCTTLEFQAVKNYNLSDIPQEYPLFGTSDMRHPSLHLINGDGNSTNTLVYQSHLIIAGKPAVDGLPCARGADDECSTLIVNLIDQISNLSVELSYTIYREHDVIARSSKIFNDSSSDIELQTALSSSLDLPASDYEVLHMTGSWSRELHEQRMPVPAGRFTISSAAGTSSNAHSPFVALMDAGASESHGSVYASTLMYSGNFAINVEKGEFGAVRVSAGINPFNFKWQLKAGESFTTPESLQVYSGSGLDQMSQIWHGFIKRHVSPPQHLDMPRPSYLNSWEAAYFDLNEDVVLSLADKAKAMGLEMLVVDDGWFEGRNDDTTSLGDWFSDEKKFPNGIEAVAAKVQAKGLKFGLWFEPEMVNQQSALYKAHPDWIIHVPNRVRSTGRQQLTLDLSRDDVVEYLFERIDSFLSCGDIDYVKWDMNRVMTEIGSAGLPAQNQLETPHRYMLGLYKLLSRIVTKYPKVLFENCASGGNRFDLGMLNFMAQGWVSDMSEPIGRLPIINGASYLFPPSVLASYIGPVPSHQNGRLASIKLRAEVGFFCAARGLSLNVPDIDQDEDELKHYIDFYKRSAQKVVGASFHRLRYTDNEVVWQLTSADQNTVYIGYFHILSGANLPLQRIKLHGLDTSASYKLSTPYFAGDDSFAGDSLTNMGLDLPYVNDLQFGENVDYMDRGDFSSKLFELTKI